MAELDDEQTIDVTTEEVADEPEAQDDGPLVVQIGDDVPEDEVSEEEVAKLPTWVQDLRKQNRERDKERRELQRRIKELEASTAPKDEAPKLGPKPTLEAMDWDDSAYETALEAWYTDKAKHDAAQRDAEAAQRAAQEAWEAKVAAYNEAKTKLPVADYDDAEALIQDTFDTTQQGLLIKVAKDAPTLVYALGKNPKKAQELAAIKDYAEFVATAVRMEMDVKTTRKPATSPERTVSVPTGTSAASTDSTLERLREEAAKTGDYSKVAAYKRSKRG